MPTKTKAKTAKSKSKSKSKSGKLADNECRCMKCKVGVVPQNMEKGKMNNGRCYMKGDCPHCGTKVFKFCKC